MTINNIKNLSGKYFYAEAERWVEQRGILFDCDNRRYQFTIRPHDYLGVARDLRLMDETLPGGSHPVVCYGLNKYGQIDDCVDRFDGHASRDLTSAQRALCAAVRSGDLDKLCEELPADKELVAIEPWQKGDDGYYLTM